MNKCVVQKDQEYLAEYLMDESRISGFTQEIAFPKNTEEIVDYVKNTDNSAITIQGARTGLNGGAVPFGNRTINLEKCNNIFELRHSSDTDQYYVGVQPGVSLEYFNKIVKTKAFDISMWDEESKQAYHTYKKAGQFFFPPDPTERSASIGGMVSCNASGACSYHYGSIRTYVEALTVILSDGEVLFVKRGMYFSKGRKFNITMNGKKFKFSLPEYHFAKRKNASCYYAKEDMDLIDLFIGSEGTLGIIAEIWLTLIRKPQECWGVLSFYDNQQELKMFLDVLHNVPVTSDAYIAAIEYFDSSTLELMKEKAYSLDKYREIPVIDRTYYAALYYEIHTNYKEEGLFLLEHTFERLTDLAIYAEDAVVAMTDVELERLKSFRHAAPDCANLVIDEWRKSDKTLTAIFTDLATPEKELFDMLDLYKKTMESKKISYIIYGHIGDWHLHVNMLPANRNEYACCMEIYEQWAQHAVRRGGTISAEHGIGRFKTHMLEYMINQEDIIKCMAIKKLFDQKDIYNIGVLFREL